jgi:CheY-like chemotaxis protein
MTGRSLPTALLVDDAEDVLLLLAMVADHGGFDAVRARTGREALAQLENGLRPAVIVADVEMPVMDGLELLSRIRGSAAFKDIPVEESAA